MTVYLNMKTAGKVETIDQFDTLKEARAMQAEYALCTPAPVYLSQRCDKTWNE